MDLPLYFRVLWRFRLVVLPGFAMIYSELADSDVVKRLTRVKPTKTEKLFTSPYAPASAPPGTVLPMVALSADAVSPDRASALINSRIAAFEGYIAKQQAD